MSDWLRALANPRVWKNCLVDKYGRTTVTKYGNVLINAKIMKRSIENLLAENVDYMGGWAEFVAHKEEYLQLVRQFNELKCKFSINDADSADWRANTFAMARIVVKMRNLYSKMQACMKQYQSKFYLAESVQKVR